MAIYVDASRFAVADILQIAEHCAIEEGYAVVINGRHLSSAEIIQITSAGHGYVSCLMDPAGAGERAT